jgi:hypothetical protein
MQVPGKRERLLMITTLLIILMTAFGTIGVTKGEFRITGTRVIPKDVGKTLGILLFIGVAGTMFLGSLFGFGTLLIVIVIGLRASKPVSKTSVQSQ